MKGADELQRLVKQAHIRQNAGDRHRLQIGQLPQLHLVYLPVRHELKGVHVVDGAGEQTVRKERIEVYWVLALQLARYLPADARTELQDVVPEQVHEVAPFGRCQPGDNRSSRCITEDIWNHLSHIQIIPTVTKWNGNFTIIYIPG